MNSSKVTFTFLLFAGMIASSCEEVTRPIHPSGVSVNARLLSDQTFQRVYVHSIRPTDENVTMEDAFISGLTVTLSTNSTSWAFQVMEDTVPGSPPFSYRSSDSVFVISGETYDLAITGNEISVLGETVVPGDFAISPPPQPKFSGGRVEFDIQWTRSLSTVGYSVEAEVKGSSLGFRANYRQFFQTQDTTLHESIDLPGAIVPDTCVFTVIANDEHYWNHVVQKKDASGISGALGYFGSSLAKQATVTVN